MKKSMLFLFLFPLVLSAQQITQLANVNGPIYAIAKEGNVTVIGGKFTTVNGNSANNIAWSTDQVNWFAIRPGIHNGVNDTVKDIKYFNGEFFICGSFYATDTMTSNFIVGWNPISNLLIPLKNISSSLNGIEHLAVVDTSLYVCGRNWGIATYAPYAPDGFPQLQSNPNINFNNQPVTIYNMTSDGTNLYFFYAFDSGGSNWIGELSDNILSSFVARGTNPPYTPNAMVLYNDTIYLAGITGILKMRVNAYADTIYPQNSNSFMVANNKLWFANSNVYTSTGFGYEQFLSTNGTIYSMMADSIYYFAGAFNVANGTTKNSFIKYEIIAPPLAKGTVSDTILCQTNRANFTSSSTGQYLSIRWLFSGGSPTSGQSNIESVTYNTPGIYPAILIATNAAGSDTIYYTISVGKDIHLIAPSSISYCSNNGETITVAGLDSLDERFYWFPSTGISNSADSFSFNSSASSSYMIYANDYGCADTVYVSVNILQSPSAPIITQNTYELSSNKSYGNQWYLNAGILVDSTNQIITPSQSGSYSIQYTDNNGCNSTSTPFFFNETGIIDIFQNDIKVYPNPTSNFIYVDGKFQLEDSQGKIVGYFDKKADLSSLPAGIYFISIMDCSYKVVKR